MRLLNVHTLTLEEFLEDNSVLNYAILSHRWEEEEVTFQDLKDYPNGCKNGKEMKGWTKIKSACAIAKEDGWNFIWIDTCCIDKSSSAELSEAINSMFRWYEKAGVCYAYLSDVPALSLSQSPYDPKSPFRRSKWFTRGWTLQELLAPIDVDFYDQSWSYVGSKGTNLDRLLSQITGIYDLLEYSHACVAKKMSWASQRVTTRVEDMAYCLLGLFGVHMPLLYGEGKNAFLRLQLEIMSKTNDDSIFAWDTRGTDIHGTSYPLLAPSPQPFRFSSSVIWAPWDSRQPHTMTSQGLCLHCPLVRTKIGTSTEDFLVPLNTKIQSIFGDEQGHRFLAIDLTKNPLHGWSRRSQLLIFDTSSMKEGSEYTTIYVPQRPFEGVIGRPSLLQLSSGRLKIRLESSVGTKFMVSAYSTRGRGATLEEESSEFRMDTEEWNGVKIFTLTIDETDIDLVKDPWLAFIILENNSWKPVVLILGPSRGGFWVDIVILEESESIDSAVGSHRRLSRGQTRISRLLDQGSLNARIRGTDGNWDGRYFFFPSDQREGSWNYRVVDVTFDPFGELPWPARYTPSALSL
ncbi:HET-domain-containing protein [Hyaloscypha variabilis F]|uniref:HET-domain-containing protein n=1 Tax=Hyaloscypha variabilis (strain UAMH 11265 / GT02V1 / F) TaxID=1149755 RepID=A0A2J6SBU4_HYAVF|nr:HET-domain-containing protein [Hyaloscypha variabilis F]